MKILLILMLVAGLAHAETRRVAIIIGNNLGHGDRPALHYAETDAGKFADVLRELGGVAPDDLFLLQGQDLTALQRALALAKDRIKAYRNTPASRIVVMFYFSGHSDGEALELGRDRLSFVELRRWLAGAGADVRVALVDSCKSGALLTAKGGTLGPAFQIRLTDDVASTGEALLTSSAADEVALESREIGGSFFTHHFISGLRGAADTSGDGIVTLTEAYQYAYAHTIKTTGETVIGPQHPAYDYRLSGQGELVLAELTKPTARLTLPRGFDRILITDRKRDQVIAEIAADAHGSIAVQPGTYTIHAWRAHSVYAGQIAVALDERRDVRADELARTEAVATTSKGGAASPWQASVAFGASGGIAEHVGARPAARLEILSPMNLSLTLAIDSRAGAHDVRETAALLFAGYRAQITRGALHAWVGGELGSGLVVQTGLAASARTAAVSLGAFAGGAVDVARDVSVVVTPAYDAALLRRDGKAALVGIPGAWLGLELRI